MSDQRIRFASAREEWRGLSMEPTTAPRPPLGSPPAWAATVAVAHGRCQCSDGRCGSRHAKDGGRCPHEDQAGARLIAAPENLLMSPARAAGIPATRLRAWCPDCYRGALARQRAAARRHQPMTDVLFDL